MDKITGICGLGILDSRDNPTVAPLNANAILAVSSAVAKAAGVPAGVPLCRWIGATRTPRVPVPMMNIINGGAHANNTISTYRSS